MRIPATLAGSRWCAAAALVLALNVAPVSAQESEAVRVRGTIESVTPDELTVKSREGDDVAIMLAPDYAVHGIAAASADDIETGDFVGVASLPTEAGGDGAIEVLIFPAEMKGTGEGSYPWDLEPNSTMTNATVSNAVMGVDGRQLTLSYPEGEKTVTLPDGIPVVTFAGATKDDLKPGAAVFVPAQKAADGTLSTGTIVVGNNGVVPPM